MSIEILPFTDKDITAALALWEHTEGMGLFGDTPDRIVDCLAHNPGLSYIAREDGALVGAALGTWDGRRGYLQHVAVAASHRRRGIGGLLVGACLAEFERRGVPRCHLFVHRDNHAAVEFWAHAGWYERTDIVMMSRTLEAGD